MGILFFRLKIQGSAKIKFKSWFLSVSKGNGI